MCDVVKTVSMPNGLRLYRCTVVMKNFSSLVHDYSTIMRGPPLACYNSAHILHALK